MARNGYQVFDSDMHVYDAQNLYEKYMKPKWGDRIPRRQGPHQARAHRVQSGQRGGAAAAE